MINLFSIVKLTFKLKIIISLLLFCVFALFFYGIIDEPVYVTKRQGVVSECIQMPTRYEYGGKINCTANLDNGHLIYFTSYKFLNSKDVIFFAEYKRTYTGIVSYGQM